MNSKLFVGNLSFNTTENELQDLFAGCGSVTDVNLITDRMSGRSKGFAFVTMSTPEEAQNAIAARILEEIKNQEWNTIMAHPEARNKLLQEKREDILRIAKEYGASNIRILGPEAAAQRQAGCHCSCLETTGPADAWIRRLAGVPPSSLAWTASRPPRKHRCPD